MTRMNESPTRHSSRLARTDQKQTPAFFQVGMIATEHRLIPPIFQPVFADLPALMDSSLDESTSASAMMKIDGPNPYESSAELARSSAHLFQSSAELFANRPIRFVLDDLPPLNLLEVQLIFEIVQPIFWKVQPEAYNDYCNTNRNGLMFAEDEAAASPNRV